MSEPVEPLSATGKARLVELFRQHGVEDTRFLDRLSVQPHSASIEPLVLGTISSMTVAIEQLRQWMGQLFADEGGGLAGAPALATREKTSAPAGSAGEETAYSRSPAQVYLDSGKRRAQVGFRMRSEWSLPCRVVVVGWTSAAVERIRRASVPVIIVSDDVFRFYEGTVASGDRPVSLSFDLPAALASDVGIKVLGIGPLGEGTELMVSLEVDCGQKRIDSHEPCANDQEKR